MMMLEKKKKKFTAQIPCVSLFCWCVCVVLCVWIGFKKFSFFFFGEDKKKKKRNFFLLVIFYTPLLVMVTILLNIEVFWNIIDL